MTPDDRAPDDRAPDDIDRIGPWTQLIFLGVGLVLVFFVGRGLLRDVGVLERQQAAVSSRPAPVVSGRSADPWTPATAEAGRLALRMRVILTRGVDGYLQVTAATDDAMFVERGSLHVFVDGADCSNRLFGDSNFEAMQLYCEPRLLKSPASVSVSASSLHGDWRCVPISRALALTVFECAPR